MGLSIRDVRHLALVTLIIAILPMLIYPNSLGLDFHLGVVWYIALELVYFYVVAMLVFKRKSVMRAIGAASLYLLGRFTLSLVLFGFLLALERIAVGKALNLAFSGFKPALLLFSLLSPFLYNSTIKGMFSSSSIRTGIRKFKSTTTGHPSAPARIIGRTDAVTVPISVQRTSGEYLNRSFDDAMKHIGSYSGVLCAMLVDNEGLRVAGWNRGDYDEEMWGALARKIVDDVEETSLRARTSRLETLEFSSGEQRFSLVRVADMWLLAIADAASDDLEKIRLHQAAEMIMRHCQERFKSIYSTDTGRKYAGSTI